MYIFPTKAHPPCRYKTLKSHRSYLTFKGKENFKDLKKVERQNIAKPHLLLLVFFLAVDKLCIWLLQILAESGKQNKI
jgi:hypothetical protein